ncbi:multifunctional acyl-CoA thioesterase I and protease I and lysophospholipase L1 [Denitratisoma oestradiolicum]|uniref:Multifunctional acyl-CoA thioesterase I and protease I and lysophospholipase L1 n=1 Tax=Denitratisoma oestradiolicum TaxID=311182 RepID=A0A6S6XZ45_9PROT|nr:arylesterase [Denitratisoma oestradiolicum]TWO79449.1 arylesterase [Denitratisoma oestradiolicum]CAB1368162.1 multifunctional acyl-CoA thioesterase I and protease I and lysophospholipase L1 [Denitratisoma oestradiolicum]
MIRSLFLVILLAGSALASARPVLIFGDSLSAGFGLAREQSWPALLEPRLRERGYTLVNASISGETTAGGRTRLAAALAQHQPALVVLELGANDGLRGLSPEQTRDNLRAMARAVKASGAGLLLVGMRLPPNYGPDYTAAFERTFTEVAKAEKAPLLPFLLEPVAADPANFQKDGLHPVAAVQTRILDHIWKSLKPLLK